jgi:NADH pyrophosphatase NudC (nudix superfamily)
MSDVKHCLRCGAVLAPVEEEGRTRLRCPSCSWTHYGNPTPVVAAIVEHRESEDDPPCVVLVRNHGWPPKWLGIVTGFLEAGEEPAAGVLRELREELGLEGEVVSLVGVYAFAQRNELIIAYHVRAVGPITLGPELERFKRVPIERLEPWPFGTGLAVRDWLAARRTG